MINDEPSVKEMAALWNVCAKFIEEQGISCAEEVYQCDWVIEHAYELIEAICEEVGYVEPDDE